MEHLVARQYPPVLIPAAQHPFELFLIHSFASSQFGPFGKIKGGGFVPLLCLIPFILLQILLAGKQGFLIALPDAVGEV